MEKNAFMALVAEELHKANTHISEQQFKSFLANSKLWIYEWGIIMAQENDMHIHILNNYRKKVFLRKPLKQVANYIFARYPVIKTSILKSKGEEVLMFDLRLGWKLIQEDATTWYLEMTQEDFKYEN